MSEDYVFAERLRKDSFINLRRFLSLIFIFVVSFVIYPFVIARNIHILMYVNAFVLFCHSRSYLRLRRRR